jgi:hypothetical protein
MPIHESLTLYCVYTVDVRTVLCYDDCLGAYYLYRVPPVADWARKKQDADAQLAKLNEWTATLGDAEHAKLGAKAPVASIQARRVRSSPAPVLYIDADGNIAVRKGRVGDTNAANNTTTLSVGGEGTVSAQFWNPGCDIQISAGWRPLALQNMGAMAILGGRTSQWCADDQPVRCNRGAIGGWETFWPASMTDLPGNQASGSVTPGAYAFRSGRTSQWCADEGSNGWRCNRVLVGQAEQFRLHEVSCRGVGKFGWAIVSNRASRFCTDWGTSMQCTATRLLGWEVHSIAAYNTITRSWVWL